MKPPFGFASNGSGSIDRSVRTEPPDESKRSGPPRARRSARFALRSGPQKRAALASIFLYAAGKYA